MAVRTDSSKRSTRQHQPKGLDAAQAGSSLPTTARDMKRKPPAELARARRRQAEALDAAAGRSGPVDFGIRVMPVEVFVSSLFGWDRTALVDCNIEIGPDRSITTQRTLGGQIQEFTLGTVPDHLAFTIAPLGLDDCHAWLVGDPQAIADVTSIQQGLESKRDEFREIMAADLEARSKNHLGFPPRSLEGGAA